MQTTTGTFLKLEWGDYLHLYITGSDGKEHSYFILKKIAVDPETLVKGQKIKVTWHNADTYLTQISQIENIDEATKIELLG